MIERPDPEAPQWVVSLLFAVLAAAGGIARYLQEFTRGFTRGKLFSLAVFCSFAFIGGFSGSMTAEAMKLIRPEWAYVAAGTGGFFGVEAMRFLLDMLRRKLGIPGNGQ